MISIQNAAPVNDKKRPGKLVKRFKVVAKASNQEQLDGSETFTRKESCFTNIISNWLNNYQSQLRPAQTRFDFIIIEDRTGKVPVKLHLYADGMKAELGHVRKK